MVKYKFPKHHVPCQIDKGLRVVKGLIIKDKKKIWITSDMYSGHKPEVQGYVSARPRGVVTLILNNHVIKTELSFRRNLFS